MSWTLLKSWIILFALGEEIPIHLLDTMKERLKGLKKNFRTYFSDLDPHNRGEGRGVRNSLVPCDTELSSSEKRALPDVKSEGQLKNDSPAIPLLTFG